jgi:L-galactose dehydrogenase
MDHPVPSARQLTTLGRSGLSCSVVGLGCGGMSRLGLRRGGTMRDAADLIRYALDLGVTFIDTAKLYGTEPAVGAALNGRREGVMVSTKIVPLTPDNQVNANHITRQIDESLRVMSLETIDVMHLHGVLPQDYARVVGECLAPLEHARKEGKIRLIGVSEFWNQDLAHDMLRMALDDDHFDMILVGCNMLNFAAGARVLRKALEKGVATSLMFAVRRAFAEPALLREICARLVTAGEIQPDEIDLSDPFGFMLDNGGADTLTEAAYRYCRHLAGVNVVLTGTSNRDHLRQNVASIEKPALRDADLRRIEAVFGAVRSVTGER